MASDSAAFAEGNFDPEEESEARSKFSTADALDIEADDTEPPEEIWGGLRLAPGQLMEIIGCSGIGKSRMMLNLAVNQVLGLDFAGLPTCRRPLTWLFYGNENGLYRYRHDLRLMLKSCTAAQRERLRGHIFLPTMHNPQDVCVSFADEYTRERLKNTIRYRHADVVVFDPWGAVIHGDELDDGDVRKTILEIVDVIAADIHKPTAGIILNHSRNGAKELAAAAGLGSANYGKNSKAIFTVMRNVWNLRPAKLGEPYTKIEMIHAKSSDFAPYPPRAVDFDPDSFNYRLDPAFDHVAWQYELESIARNGSSMTSREKKVAVAKKKDADRQKILDFIRTKGHVYKAELDNWAHTEGIGVNAVRNFCSELENTGEIARIVTRFGNKAIIGTPAAIEELKSSAAPDAYRN